LFVSLASDYFLLSEGGESNSNSKSSSELQKTLDNGILKKIDNYLVKRFGSDFGKYVNESSDNDDGENKNINTDGSFSPLDLLMDAASQAGIPKPPQFVSLFSFYFFFEFFFFKDSRFFCNFFCNFFCDFII
jgi:hypothetical protein